MAKQPKNPSTEAANEAPGVTDGSPVSEAPAAPAATSKKKEVVMNSVKMTDGRVVDFPGDTKALKEFSYNAETGTVTGRIDFASGDTVSFETKDINLIGLGAAHGFGQKFGDSYAAIKDPAEAYQTCATLVERIQRDGVAGWARQSGGGGSANLGLLVQACMEATGADAATVRAYLDTQSNEVKNALRDQDPTIAPIYQRLKAERDAKKPAPKVDLSGAIAGLHALAKATTA